MTSLDQHQKEISKNLQSWDRKPLLRSIYGSFYRRIGALIDPSLPGHVVEIGSGIGNLRSQVPQAICTDLFPNPWLDLVCDGYDLPFANESVSHLVLFDVFHHLRAPRAFCHEAQRVLAPRGRLILFEPFLSLTSFPVYGLLHHEPLAWNKSIDLADELPRPRDYYAAQGNATRLFFKNEAADWLPQWRLFHREAFSAFSYLFSGGYSKPSFYPASWLSTLQSLDTFLSRFPGIFGARCLIGLSPLTEE